MEQLIARIAQAAHLSTETASTALGLVLNFLDKEAPEQLRTLLGLFPEAQQLMTSAAAAGSNGLSGMLGGLLSRVGGSGNDIMALGSQLLGQGLSIDQSKIVASELLDFARQEFGEEHVNELLKSIPALSQLL